jgi:hypothetical protein
MSYNLEEKEMINNSPWLLCENKFEWKALDG